MTSVTAFLDTSTFLHFHWLDNIDWRSLFTADHVDLVVAAVVLDELDQKKHDGSPKLKRRATAVLQKLNPFLLNATVSSPVREKVRVRFVGNATAVDFPAKGLDYRNNDDRLIAAMLECRDTETEANLVLVTGDGGLTMRASLQSICVLKLPDTYAQHEEPDPLEAENRALKQKLVDLENRMAKLLIIFSDNTDRREFEIHPPVDVPEAELTRRSAELEAKYPIYSQRSVGTLSAAFGGLLTVPTTSEIERYHKEREAYFGEMRQFWIRTTAAKSKVRRSIELALTINNGGTAVAENVIVDLHFPDGLVIHENPQKLPNPPRAPEPPRNQMQLLSQPSLMTSIARALSESVPVAPRLENVSRPNIERTNSYRVRVTIGRVQHHVPLRLPELFVEFEEYEGARSFSVEWTVRTASLPHPVSGDLHVIVTKKP